MNLDALAASLTADPAISGFGFARSVSNGGPDVVGVGIDVVGVGIDVVDVARFARIIERTPRLIGRVFTTDEWNDCRSAPSLVLLAAQLFTAKEAAVKALGCGIFGLRLSDLAVASGPGERDGPLMVTGPSAQAAMAARGVDALVVRLSHSDDLAGAVVVAIRQRL